MEDVYLLVGAVVLLVIQIVCFFTKKIWIRLLPVLITGWLMVLCLVLYGVGGFTNWGFLILLVLLFAVLVGLGVAWFIYGLVCLIRKKAKKRRV